MGIRDRPTAPRSPWQNGYAERLIGSIRRECIDHVIIFGERHLRHVLQSYLKYYNEIPTGTGFALRFPYHYNADMRQALRLHPDSRCVALTQIEVEVTRPRAGSLILCYFATGRMGNLRLPPAVATTHTDELWRHTCFEAFVGTSPGAAYYEFNFAPSTQWAAYRFNSYRSGMRVATEISAPNIEVQSSRACYRLHASLALDQMSSLPSDGVWRIGLAAVIEETGGHKSYWALAHPPGKADFHHSDGFALELSQSVRP